LTPEFNWKGNNTIHFYLTENALYLIQGLHLHLERISEKAKINFFENKYLAKYEFNGWSTNHGTNIINFEKAMEVKQNLEQILSIIENFNSSYMSFNTNENNVMRYVYPNPIPCPNPIPSL
jgi:hypothetical protein